MKGIQMFVKRNSSTILTVIGAIGVVATAVVTAKATPKALKALEVAEEEKGEELTTVEKVKTAAPAYIPAVVTGAATITCVFGANVLNKRQQASLASAYMLLDNQYKRYQNKVTELLGEQTHKLVRNEVVKDIYDSEDIEIEPNQELFYDMESKSYFPATMDDVMDAVDHINGLLEDYGCVCVNEFYEYLGIAPIYDGNELGWSMYASRVIPGVGHIRFDIDTVELEDGLECTIITMLDKPRPNFKYRKRG